MRTAVSGVFLIDAEQHNFRYAQMHREIDGRRQCRVLHHQRLHLNAALYGHFD